MVHGLDVVAAAEVAFDLVEVGMTALDSLPWPQLMAIGALASDAILQLQLELAHSWILAVQLASEVVRDSEVDPAQLEAAHKVFVVVLAEFQAVNLPPSSLLPFSLILLQVTTGLVLPIVVDSFKRSVPQAV